MRWVGAVLSVALLAGAIWVVDDILGSLTLADVTTEFAALPLARILAALAFTAASYLVLIFYDVLGLRHVGRVVSAGRVAVTSFVSYVFAHNIGFGVITGASVRYRLYGAAGMSALEIAAVSLFCSVTFALGIAGLGGAALLVEPASTLAAIPGMPVVLGRALGVILVGTVIAYLVACLTVRQSVSVGGVDFRFPEWRIALGQVGAAAADITLAAFAMYVVMPGASDVSPWGFLGAFVLAILIGAVSNLPGGIGVFEAALTLLLPQQAPQQVLAAALAFRVVYYLVPFAVAAALVLGAEIIERRALVRDVGKSVLGALMRFAPQISGVFVLMAGAVLLVSGANPALEERLGPLTDIVPLALVEASHLLASVIGVALLVLARGLARRLDAAYYAALIALGAGIVFSLLKGFDYEEALILTAVLALVAFSRAAFHRRTPLFITPFAPAWIATVVVIVGAAGWLGLFAYRHVEYSHDLWWTFAVDADAPRFLRAQLVTTVLVLGGALFLALRPIKPLRSRLEPRDLETVGAVVAGARATSAHLALLGDKQILFNSARDGFVMYGVQGGSIIAMGDPVAATTEARAELAWSFRELCDEHDRRPVFYQVGDDNLPLYVDMGLSLQKLGEEALIALGDFSLDGPQRRELRQTHARAVREGLTFEVISTEAVPGMMAELKAVSDAWHEQKSTREKGFSVGAFAPAYIAQGPCAVVRAAHPDGSRRLVGFANLWLGGGHEELSVDLMRHVDDAPYGVMDFLFIEIMLWGRANGYRWFNLGLAPLAGLEEHPLAPIWHRVGGFVFRHGENFYNFGGLRRYKTKFQPEWRPKYLATQGGLSIAAALIDVSTLVAGGVRGLVTK